MVGCLVAGFALVVLASGPLSPANPDTLGTVEPDGDYFSAAFPPSSIASVANSRIGSKQYFVGNECFYSYGFIIFKILLSHVIHFRLRCPRLSEPERLNICFLRALHTTDSFL